MGKSCTNATNVITPTHHWQHDTMTFLHCAFSNALLYKKYKSYWERFKSYPHRSKCSFEDLQQSEASSYPPPVTFKSARRPDSNTLSQHYHHCHFIIKFIIKVQGAQTLKYPLAFIIIISLPLSACSLPCPCSDEIWKAYLITFPTFTYFWLTLERIYPPFILWRGMPLRGKRHKGSFSLDFEKVRIYSLCKR